MNLGYWDTIATIATSEANRQLAANAAKLLQTFSYSGQDAITGAPYSLKGTFGAWSIVSGGSGEFIRMSLPITSGTLTRQAGPVDISGAVVEVNVKLILLPSATDPKTQELRFAFTEGGASASSNVIAGRSCTLASAPTFASTIQGAVVACLLGNASEVTYVFAQVGLLDGSVPSWLVPTESQFLYQEPKGAAEGCLAILSRTSFPSYPDPFAAFPGIPVVSSADYNAFGATSPTYDVPPGLVSTQYPAGFAMSKRLFMLYVLLPQMSAVFKQAPAGSFSYDPNSGTPSLCSDTPFNTADVKAGLLEYHPSINSVQITLAGSLLSTAVGGTCGIKLTNAYISFSFTLNSNVGYDAGSQQLTFTQANSSTPTTSQHLQWYDYLEGGGAIGAAVIAVLTKTLFPQLESSVVNSLTASTSGENFASAGTMPVSWKGTAAFTPQVGGVSDSFYLLGGPTSSASNAAPTFNPYLSYLYGGF